MAVGDFGKGPTRLGFRSSRSDMPTRILERAMLWFCHDMEHWRGVTIVLGSWLLAVKLVSHPTGSP